MPQDSRKSFAYRSFIRCNDPKGVVECSTIRKSKTVPQGIEGTVESGGEQKNLNLGLAHGRESKEVRSREVAVEVHNPSSFQLMEVSEEAQKPNGVVESWSKGATFDGHSKEIAKDLLKGAFDLHKSLIMLGRLQEASQYMATLTTNQGKSEREGIDTMGTERMNSNRLLDQNCQIGFQKPRFSADGSSRDCYEELRQAIKDGLAKQNLLPRICVEEKANYDRYASNLPLDVPSTSSSQSSVDHSYKFSSSESSFSSIAPQRKPSGPNLIAKLMGLEQIPSEPLQSTRGKQFESDKHLKQRKRPVFDIDMSKAKMPQFDGQKFNPEQRTLKDILGSTHSKELSRSSLGEGFNPPSHHHNKSNSNNRSIDDVPPIVTMKPLCFSCIEAEVPYKQMFTQAVGASNGKEMPRKLRTKKEFSPKTIDPNEEVLSFTETCRESLAGRKCRIKRSMECEGVLAKPETRKFKTKKKLSPNKIKTSVPVNHKAEKMEAIDKKIDKIQKVVTPNRRKTVGMENVKSVSLSKSNDQARLSCPKLEKSKKVSNIMRSQAAQRKSTTSKSISRIKGPIMSHSSTEVEKNSKDEKPDGEPLSSDLAAEIIGCGEDTKRVNGTHEEFNVVVTKATSADQPLSREGTKESIQNQDHCNNIHNSPCEFTPQTIQHESSIQSAKEENCCASYNSTENKSFSTGTNPRDLLLRNPPFLSKAEELFDVDGNQPIPFPPASMNDCNIGDTRFLLDYANEVMELRSIWCTQSAHSFLHNPLLNSRYCISFDKVVEEICIGIDHLANCSKLAGDIPRGGMRAILEGDLMPKGMVSGTWDLGWRNGYTMDEIEQVMGDVEKLVLGSLVEEVLAEFSL